MFILLKWRVLHWIGMVDQFERVEPVIHKNMPPFWLNKENITHTHTHTQDKNLWKNCETKYYGIFSLRVCFHRDCAWAKRTSNQRKTVFLSHSSYNPLKNKPMGGAKAYSPTVRLGGFLILIRGKSLDQGNWHHDDLIVYVWAAFEDRAMA